MKKIAHIIIGLNVGGAELMLKRLVLHSSAKGKFEHCVISLTDLGIIGQQLRDAGIEVYSVGMNSFASTSVAFIRLRKLLKKINPDVVQTWMYHADFLGGMAAKSLGIKKIIWGIRNSEIDSNSGIAKKVIRQACAGVSNFIPSSIVCVANKAKEVHIAIGYDDQKMVVIPNGFDLSIFYPDEQKRERLRTQFNISSEELAIGHMGRFAPAKNHINFIKACLLLLDKGYRFKVLLGGREVDLDNPEIARLFANNLYKDSFVFLSQVQDTAIFYNAIDVFCLTSITEGFPNVLGEAMATQKVCLSTDAGDAKIILNDSGYHIPSTDYQDIAKTLEKNVLNAEPSQLEAVAKKARLTIERNYTLDKVVNDFEALYR